LSYQREIGDDSEQTLAEAAAIMIKRDEFSRDDQVVVISDALAGSGFEALEIRKISDLL
jgi:pyruvate kinase